MWQLSMKNAAKEWVEVGRFDTVTAAARRIRELEDYPHTGVFLEMLNRKTGCWNASPTADSALLRIWHMGPGLVACG